MTHPDQTPPPWPTITDAVPYSDYQPAPAQRPAVRPRTVFALGLAAAVVLGGGILVGMPAGGPDPADPTLQSTPAAGTTTWSWEPDTSTDGGDEAEYVSDVQRFAPQIVVSNSRADVINLGHTICDAI